MEGGEGSGNFGHAGRPGEKGGSSNDGIMQRLNPQDDSSPFIYNNIMTISPGFREDSLEELAKAFGQRPEDLLKFTAKAYQELGIKSGSTSGYCDVVSVGIWKALGSPKNIVPYQGLMNDETYHVVLYNKATDTYYDATNSQFGSKIDVVYGNKADFTEFKRIPKVDILDFEQQYEEMKNDRIQTESP